MADELMQNITILGATGSIGISTLDVVARHPERFKVFALTACRQVDKLVEQCICFQPRYAVMVDRSAAVELRSRLSDVGCQTEVLEGARALVEVASATEVDIVMAAIVGAAGLPPSLAAAQAGKKVLLANKEALVSSGQLFMEAVKTGKACLLPIDSEHNAIFQALPYGYARDPSAAGVSRILLTASGGPFRRASRAELENVTPEQACAHPNWVMGRKISVDSATMMNKGLEVIEAYWLFNVPADQIEVLVHPQSVIHSLVQYVDGSVLAQLGNPDMRTPIAYALAWPERMDAGVRPLDLFEIGSLAFEKPDMERFPCLKLAYQALQAHGAASAVLNAANEEAVAAFLESRVGFCQIADIVAATLDRLVDQPVDSLEAVLEMDAWARDTANQLIRHYEVV